jgi:hypothetical protein
MTDNPAKPVPLSFPPLDIPVDLAVVYSNLARIAHSPSELVFDFAHLLPGTPQARVNVRVVMSPLGAKLFYRALAENLARFEASFGEIPIPGQKSLADSLFHPPSPPEDNPPK